MSASDPPGAALDRGSDDPEDRIAELERTIREMDERALFLEGEVARRGVKLSCANIALARAKLAFEDITRTREEAVQEIAHDLRTPLTSIHGATQNLLSGVVGPMDDEVREYVEIMQRQSERLIDVVNWLVEAMRITSEPLELSPTPVDIAELVGDTIRDLGPIAEERGISMSFEPSPMHLEVDIIKIRQVIENLVGNALKFTDPGGSVRVQMSCTPSGSEVRVVDTGIGMDSTTVQRVFDRYYRKAHDTQGTGLGLVISKEIARMHEGDITVKSKEGQGSTFVLHLPPPT